MSYGLRIGLRLGSAITTLDKSTGRSLGPAQCILGVGLRFRLRLKAEATAVTAARKLISVQE